MNYKSVIARNQTNGNACTKENIDEGQAMKKIVHDQEYILLPLLTSDPSLSKSSKNSPDAGFKPSGEEEKKDAKDPENEDKDNAVDENIVYGCIDDPNMPNLEEIVYSDDDEEVGVEADMNNLATTMPISPIPTIRVHKDHPLEQIIGDTHSTPQTRRMTKSVTEHVEPKKVIQALTDPRWIEAMHDELLQFKLQKVWTLVDLPYGKRAIGFEDPEFPNKVYKVKKALYGLHQAPRAWCMHMTSSLGLLKSLYVKQKDDGIFISQDKYVADILKKFDFATVMYLTTSRPDIMFVVCACARDSPFDLEAFSDSDYTGGSLDKKSTTGDCQFLRRRKAKRVTEISQSSRPIPFVSDETVIKEWEDRMERAATTASSLEAEQDSDSGPRCHDTILGGVEAQIRINLLLPILVYAARHTLTAVRHKLMLSGITCYCWFWTSAKAKTANGERQIKALVDKKKVIITKTSIRSDLKLDDAEGTDCLPTTTIFAELERMSTMASAIICLATNQKFNFSKYIFDNMVKNLEGGVKFLMYPRFVQVFLDNQVEGMSKDKGIYVIPSYTKKVFANMKRPGKGFSGRVTPLFQTMMVQASEDMGEDSAAPTDSHSTPIILQPSSSKPQKKNLQEKVHDLEKANTTQAKEISSFKKRFKQLEKRRTSRTPGLKRLRKVGSASRVESSNDVSLGAQEDASKQGRKIAALDADEEVTLIDETQGRNDEDLMFDTSVFEEPISVATTTSSIPVSAADLVTTAGKVVTTASAEILDELTLAQTLIKIKSIKPKVVTTTATTVTPVSTRRKAKGVVIQETGETTTTTTKIVPIPSKVQDPD
ncbi:hypothetical protein Tco_1018718 [Tanacetum coccineum]|uniref:Reverse transcriptase Ty1/copia-type domain-containing protein n=1 Tax=Tanacetum coccineum TaxID=301880 RepID=A0ABQ5FWI5_9ASTR